MCPLRFILIFLSATLAGFFLLRNLKSQPQDFEAADDNSDTHSNDLSNSNSNSASTSTTTSTSKVCSAVQSGFWTVVDMASGRYLWRHLFPSSSPKRSD